MGKNNELGGCGRQESGRALGQEWTRRQQGRDHSGLTGNTGRGNQAKMPHAVGGHACAGKKEPVMMVVNVEGTGVESNVAAGSQSWPIEKQEA